MFCKDKKTQTNIANCFPSFAICICKTGRTDTLGLRPGSALLETPSGPCSAPSPRLLQTAAASVAAWSNPQHQVWRSNWA